MSTLAWDAFATNHEAVVLGIKEDSKKNPDKLFLVYKSIYRTMETNEIEQDLRILTIPQDKITRFIHLHTTKAKDSISILVCYDTKCNFFQVKF